MLLLFENPLIPLISEGGTMGISFKSGAYAA